MHQEQLSQFMNATSESKKQQLHLLSMMSKPLLEPHGQQKRADSRDQKHSRMKSVSLIKPVLSNQSLHSSSHEHAKGKKPPTLKLMKSSVQLTASSG